MKVLLPVTQAVHERVISGETWVFWAFVTVFSTDGALTQRGTKQILEGK